jgi:O-antigen/teichoic acid export membrane protein
MLVISTFLINSVLNFALGLLVARFLGPVGFGQYAIAAAIAIVLNVLFYEWIRLSATRFYSEKTRSESLAVRRTLDTAFAIASAGITIACALGIAVGMDFGLMTGLAAFAPAMAICNGMFDYHTALLRARFEERSYSVLVMLKNAFAFLLMVGGAWWFQSPIVVAAGFVVSIFATMLLGRRTLRDPGVRKTKADWTMAGHFIRYSLPVVVATLIYFLIPLWNRTTIATSLGFSASGQFSLGYDIAIRVIQTVGSALDIVLFQIALKTEDEQGQEQAQKQLSVNMGIVLAIISALTTGYWLVLPSFEATLVPEAFRGNFATITSVLLPGLACYVIIQAAVTPVFQLKRKTMPLILAAATALVINTVLTWSLGIGATIVDYAVAQSLGYAAALAIAMALALREMRVLPSLRDMFGTLVSTGLMVAAVWPLRAMSPGPLVLVASVGIGGSVFLLTALAFNLAGCRNAGAAAIKRFRDRQ